MIIDSVIEHNISTAKYNPLASGSYIRLLKELDHPRKALINIQKIDNNESFIWSIVKYLNPANYCSVKITKPNKDFAQKVEFKDIKFLVKTRNIYKIKDCHWH